MTITKRYRYLGDNGIIETHIRLEGAVGIILYHLQADDKKLLTNGINKVKSIVIPEVELSNWTEIPE